jgi:hypothetical protein
MRTTTLLSAILAIDWSAAHAQDDMLPTDSGAALSVDLSNPVTLATIPLPPDGRPLIGASARPAAASSTAASTPPVIFGTINNDVLNIKPQDGAGAVQIIGVDQNVGLTLGVRLAAPAVFAAGGLIVLPWASATYQYDVNASEPKLPTLLTGNVTLGGGVNLFSDGSFAASISGDWQRRDGVPGVAGLGRLRVGF